MEFILCHSHFVMLPGRNRSYCLGTAAVLGNPMSPVRLESICWLAQSGQTVLCAPEYQSENILNTIFKKCLIPLDSFCIWNVSIIYKTSDVKKEKKKIKMKAPTSLWRACLNGMTASHKWSCTRRSSSLLFPIYIGILYFDFRADGNKSVLKGQYFHKGDSSWQAAIQVTVISREVYFAFPSPSSVKWGKILQLVGCALGITACLC